MRPRLDPLDGTIVTFAVLAPGSAGDWRELVTSGLAAGVDGISSAAWLTRDGVPVLNAGPTVGGRLRRRRIGHLHRSELGDDACTPAELYRVMAETSPTAALSLDVTEPGALGPIVADVRAADAGAEQRLWLCHHEPAGLQSARSSTGARLVLVPSSRSFRSGPERQVAELRAAGIDGVRLPHRDWHGGLVALAHRFERLALASGLEHEREMAGVLNAGIDGIYSDRIERMVATRAQFG